MHILPSLLSYLCQKTSLSGSRSKELSLKRSTFITDFKSKCQYSISTIFDFPSATGENSRIPCRNREPFPLSNEVDTTRLYETRLGGWRKN
jgi:hypothetical protein